MKRPPRTLGLQDAYAGGAAKVKNMDKVLCLFTNSSDPDE